MDQHHLIELTEALAWGFFFTAVLASRSVWRERMRTTLTSPKFIKVLNCKVKSLIVLHEAPPIFSMQFTNLV